MISEFFLKKFQKNLGQEKIEFSFYVYNENLQTTMPGNIIITENGLLLSSFNGITRDDWWGDITEKDEFMKENYDRVDFLLEVKRNYTHSDFIVELREEFEYRISKRDYPPGFSYY